MGPIGTSFCVALLAICELIAWGSGVAQCWGGCSKLVVTPSLLFMGCFAALGIVCSKVSFDRLRDAQPFSILVACVFLVPGALVSIVGGLAFLVALIGLIWQGLSHVLR